MPENRLFNITIHGKNVQNHRKTQVDNYTYSAVSHCFIGYSDPWYQD